MSGSVYTKSRFLGLSLGVHFIGKGQSIEYCQCPWDNIYLSEDIVVGVASIKLYFTGKLSNL